MVKRKRIGKVKTNKLTLKDVAAKRQKAAARELKRTQRDLKEAKKELGTQRQRKKNAPAPIEKRKDLGYGCVAGGMRADLDERRRRKEAKREERKRREESSSTSSRKKALKRKSGGDELCGDLRKTEEGGGFGTLLDDLLLDERK